MTQNNDKCVLNEASNLINGDRAKLYGESDKDTYRLSNMVAGIWSAMTGTTIPARMVPLMIASMKHARHICNGKRDNLVDSAGYMGVVERIERYEETLSIMDGINEPFVEPKIGVTMHHGEPVGYHTIKPTARITEGNGAD